MSSNFFDADDMSRLERELSLNDQKERLPIIGEDKTDDVVEPEEPEDKLDDVLDEIADEIEEEELIETLAEKVIDVLKDKLSRGYEE